MIKATHNRAIITSRELDRGFWRQKTLMEIT